MGVVGDRRALGIHHAITAAEALTPSAGGATGAGARKLTQIKAGLTPPALK
jgi:hypothetical protein